MELNEAINALTAHPHRVVRIAGTDLCLTDRFSAHKGSLNSFDAEPNSLWVEVEASPEEAATAGILARRLAKYASALTDRQFWQTGFTIHQTQSAPLYVASITPDGTDLVVEVAPW